MTPVPVDDVDAEEPITRRESVAGLAALVARTRAFDEHDDGAEATMAREPSFDLLSLASGTEDDAVAMMRSLYVSGDAEGALVVAALVRAASSIPVGLAAEDPFGGLIPVHDEDDAAAGEEETSIEYLDSVFLEVDDGP